MKKNLLSSLILALTINPVYADCTDLLSRAQADIDNTRIENYPSLIEDIENDNTCDASTQKIAIREIIRSAYTQPIEGVDGDVASSLEAIYKRQPNWHIAEVLGDSARMKKDYQAAAEWYAKAYDDIQSADGESVSMEHIAKLLKKGDEAGRLSPNYVSGITAVKVRGVTPKKTALPVTFKFNSTEFTEKGQDAANDLVRILVQQGSPDILLVGHTDQVGDENYNRSLSLRRAEKVAQLLVENDYQGRIHVDGKGEDEPPVLDGQSYTRNELDQLARRVELVLNK